jgi:hypothetical protein
MGVLHDDFDMLCYGVDRHYGTQLAEGMDELPDYHGCTARKYAGSGWGGYALYLFGNPSDRAAVLENGTVEAMAVEPYWRAPK